MKEPGTIGRTLQRVLLERNRQAAAERFRLDHERLALAPTMRAILGDALLHAMPVTELERKYCWPARSAKAIVGVLLDLLAEDPAAHPPAPQTDGSGARRKLEHLCAFGFNREIARHMDRWGLSQSEARVLEIMRRAPDMTISRDAMLARMYPHDDDPPDPRIFTTCISNLRRKLAGSPVRIKTLPGLGWKLDWPEPESVPASFEKCHHAPVGADEVSDEELLDYIAEPEADRNVMKLMTRFGLTRAEAMFLDMLHAARGRVVSRDAMYRRLYREDAAAAQPKMLDVLLAHIRPKIAPHGWRIITHRGEGWRLLPPTSVSGALPAADSQEVGTPPDTRHRPARRTPPTPNRSSPHPRPSWSDSIAKR